MLKPPSDKKKPGEGIAEFPASRTNSAPEDLMPFVLHEAFKIPGLQTKDWQIRGALVPISALELVTKTQMKFDVAAAVKGEVVTLQAAKEELAALTDDWNRPEWKELDWSKIKDLQFLETLEARKQQIKKAEECVSISCPKFARHVSFTNVFFFGNGLSDSVVSMLCAMRNIFCTRTLRS
jgi:antiviral helicase SKI2